MKTSNRKRFGVSQTIRGMRGKALNVSMAVLLAFTMVPVSAFTYDSKPEDEAAIVATQGGASATQGADGADPTGQGATPGEESQEEPQGENDAEAGSVVENGSAQGDADADQNSPETDVEDQQQGGDEGDVPDASEENDAQQPSQAPAEGDGSDAGSPDAGATTETVPDDESTGGGSFDEEVKEPRDPIAWEGDLEAVSFDGWLTVNAGSIDGSAWDAAELPQTVPATLRFKFEIDPAEQELLAGDWVEVGLPSFLHAEEAKLDAFRLGDDDGETDEKIADAEIASGYIKVTLTEDAVAEGSPAVVRGYVDVPVMLPSALLGEEETQQSWVVQVGEDGIERVIVLELPAYDAVLSAWKTAISPIGVLGSVLGLSDGTVTAQSAGARDATTDDMATVTVTPGSFNYQVGSTITWCDNNYGGRPTPESLEAGFIPQYSLDGEEYLDLVNENGKVTDQARAALHLDDNAVNRIESSDLIQITQTAVNTYEILTSALPQEIVTTTRTPSRDDDGNYVYDENGDQVFKEESSYQPIKWQLKDTNEYSGYVDGENSAWDHQYKMLTSKVSFNVVGKTGDQTLAQIFDADDEEDFQFSASINNIYQRSISVAEAIREGLLTITDTETGCTITGILPTYDEQGYPIVYYVKYTGAKEGTDYYQVSYDNSASASHGSAIDAVYNGGTMTLRHAGTTTYKATKVWLDGDSTERPAVTFTLWRYSTNGGNATTASQVNLNTNETVDGTSQTNASYVTVTIPEKSADSVDLHRLLYNTYGEAIEQLPKYDPDGYPYIYALREEALPGYEQVFGVVGEDGSVKDQLPSYQDANGDWVDYDQNARPDNDRFVYNNGTISNRLTGTVEVNLTKTWEIAAFQDSLQDVVCTFQAQSRIKGSNDEWKKVDSEEATQELTGWNAETLTKTVNETFAKYDAFGNELEYRWVETNVELEGQNTEFTTNEDGTASFYIQVTDSDGIDEKLEFTSTPQTSADGMTTITNTFKNVTDQHVDKYWEQSDGTQAQIAPDPNYSDANATIELYQDGVLIGNFTMDGQTDSNATSIQNLSGATWQETRSYHIDFLDLPKYSPEGKRYTYLVLETSKQNWATERTYDSDTRTTRIDNYFPEGEGSEIRITKSWLDGDDAGHRLKVKVQLKANHYIESDAKDKDGQPLHSYDEGEIVATVVLSSEELWYAEVDVPIGGLSYNDFTAVETELIDDKGTEDTADDVHYPVVTRTEAENQYPGELWINAGWTNPNNRRVATPEHVYEVKSQYNDTFKSCEVTNRRLGLLDLTVEKSWGDGLGNFTEATATDNPRPSATITLSCDEYPQAFSLDEQGYLIVSVSGNRLPVTNSDGSPVKARIVDTDGNGAIAGNAVVEIDADNQSSTYTFYGLPKYDANGMNVHYSVNEAWTGDSGDYNTTKEVGGYIVEEGARHFHDTQTIKFNNSRSGTRDVVFYKIWHDNYVSTTLNQRPDIYLTLYRMVKGGQPEVVDGYVHFSWSSLAEDGDAANEQKVTISGMSKYDTNGNEYIYYATEQMSADGASLDYGAVQFDYASINEADASDNEVGTIVADAEEAVKIDESTESEDPKSDGTGWAIREDGTFVNRLSSKLVATGTKLWENIPGRFEQSDLPEITVYLQRKLANEDTWPALYLQKNEEGAWSVKDEEGAVAETSSLKEVTNNQYTYEISTGYNGDSLPRYDADGNLYEYRAVEVIWGLYEQPGGFTDDDLDPDHDDISIDIAEAGESENSSLTGAAYTIQHGETGSFLLRNVYNSEKGNLTVKKLFAGRVADDEYPDVTFDVYRYYVGESGKSTPEFVASHTLTDSDFSTSADTDGNNSATYTFNDLDVYAPDGSWWAYYVVEHDINGYATKVAVGDISDVNDSSLQSDTSTDDGVRTPSLGEFDSEGNVTGSAIAADETVDATFANTYDPESVDLQGTKEWNDYNDIFSVRPGSDQIKLAFRRTAGDMSEDVGIQSEDPAGANYFAWTNDVATGDWTFVLNNVEKWAPNGRAWTYTVTETTDEDVKDHYTIVTGSSSVSAASNGSEFKLKNALNGKATVSKTWDDGGDPYGLRPSAVTVELQARYAAVDGSGSVSESYTGWENAYSVWKVFANEDDLNNQGFTEESTKRPLSDGNGWRGSWTNLPVLAREDASSPLYAIQYRVVEVQIGEDQKVEVISGDDGPYKEEYPYQPSQTTTYDETNTISATSITNELRDTAISATKNWIGDEDDAWGTRPDDGGTWSVTYFLQRKTEGEEQWSWVIEADSDADPDGSATQDGVVKLTITEADDGNTVTWDNLPQADEEGNSYQYRVVEQVPGSYDVVDGIKVEDTDTSHRYYVVEPTTDSGANSAQAFRNKLRTVDLQGTKVWEDFGTGIAGSYTAADMPQMTLYRATKTGENSWSSPEQVKMKDGGDPQPVWTKVDDGSWAFTYSGLPAADEQDRPYTYWAEEVDVTTDGFYPLYGTGEDQDASSHDASGTKIEKEATATDPGQQTNETITNVATKLSLDKVSDFDTDPGTEGVQGEQLANIELSVMSADGGTTYAVWTNGDGETYSTYTWVNGTKDPADKSDADHRIDNLIVGLKAGNYIVRETGKVPDGYAKAPDVKFTIKADGTANASSNVITTTENNIHTINVTATDPVLRGHLQLTKHVSDDGTYDGASAAALVGAKFDLYRVDVDNDGKDERIASGLTTDSQGVITTVGNDATISEKSSTGDFDLTYGGKYTKLSDGLPEGTYYFAETDAGATAVTPNGETAKSEQLVISQDNHYDYTNSPVSTTMGNEKFNATVVLHKYDTVTNAGIKNAQFSLSYTPEGSNEPSSRTVETDANGTLTLSDLEKGAYTLVETSNTGYDITNPFKATFTIDNNDDDKTFDIKNNSDGSAIGFTVTQGTFTDGLGIANTPLRGSVTMAKTDANNNALNGAIFELQRMNGADWIASEPTTVASGLVTGQNYQMDAANTDFEGVGTAGEDGQIQVDNLLWGTYRFVETTPAPGYVGVSSDGSAITSADLVISREELQPSLVGDDSVRNAPTLFKLKKQNKSGQALQGARFEVMPIDDSEFADGSTDAKLMESGDDGCAVLSGQLVVGGTYEVKEVLAPAGYEIIADILEFTVKDNGTIEKSRGNDSAWAVSAEEGAAVVTVTDEPIQVAIAKQAVGSDNPLPGAKFVVSGKFLTDEGEVATESTERQFSLEDESARATIDGLVVGETYKVVETEAPAGYEKLGEFTFRVSDQGTIVEEEGEGYTVEDGGLTIVGNDTPIEAKIVKTGKDNTPLAGATFVITNNDNPGDTLTVTTAGEDGSIVLDSAWLVAGATYTIEETHAPEGFELAGKATFRVGEDGSLVFLQADGTEAAAAVCGEGGSGTYLSSNESSVATITVADEGIAAQLIKQDTEGEALAGATFELALKDDPESAEELEVGEDGLTALPGLVAGGTYVLREVAAPAGYELNGTAFEFTVGSDGSISAADQEGYAVVNDDGVITVTATDEPIEVTLCKRDLEETGIDGAVFALEGIFANGDGTPAGAVEERTICLESDSLVIRGLIASHGDVQYVYTLTEQTAPAGYELAGSFQFTVDQNGDVVPISGQRSDATAGYESTEDSIAAYDAPVEIRLLKTDLSGAALDGAVFQVAPAEGCVFAGGGVDAIEVTPAGATEALSAKLVAGQTYVLTETKAPEGYEAIDGSFTFTVGADGTVVPAQEGNDPAYAVDDANLTITATDTPIEVFLVKRSLDGEQLAGAHFALAEASTPGLQLGGDIVSTAEGAVAIPGLVAGTTYVLSETQPAAGFETAPGSFTFRVNADGTLSVPAGVDNGAYYSHFNDADSGLVTVTVEDAPVQLRVEKVNAEGERLSGALFRIAPAEGSSFADGATEPREIAAGDGMSEVVSQQLAAGQTYVLTETKAPAGYERIDGSFTFTVNVDGTIAPAQEGNHPAFRYAEASDGVITVTAVDEPISIELAKTDLGGTALDGARFQLTGVFADEDGTPAQRESTRTIEVEDGSVSVGGLIASYDGDSYEYRLVETKAPDGYGVVSGTFVFTVDPAGNLVFGEGDLPAGYTAQAGGAEVSVADAPVQVTIRKQGEDGAPLEGAAFLLTGRFSDGSAEKTVEPGVEGSVIDGLIVGESYELAETKAPDGYEKLGSIRLTVNSDGTVSGTGAGYEVGSDGVTVVARDTAIHARLAKVDAAGAPLEGAVFAIVNAGDPDDAKTFTTGADGFAAIDPAWLVAGRTYTVVELKAPDGFELAGSASFTVASDGTLALVAEDGTAAGSVLGTEGSGSYGVSVGADGVAVLTAADSPIAAQLAKVDLDGEPLGGASFELTAAEGSSFSDGTVGPRSAQTGEDGLTALPGLVAGGTYVLSEVTAPAGYELNGTAFEFTVGSDGSISAADQEGYAVDNDDGVITVTATDEPIEIGLAKSDTEGNALDGARFAIEGVFAAEGGASEGGVTQRTFEVAAEGATVDGLVAGQTYVITELAPPAGYAVAGSFSFTVGADGTVGAAEGQQQAADGAEGYRIAANGLQISIADAPIEAQLVKRSFEGEALEGARFAIEGSFAGDFADEASLQIGPTDADGAAGVPAGALVAGQTYVLTETSAPSGFELAGSVRFTVGEDGAIALVGIGDAQGAVAGSDGSGAYSAAMVDGAAVVTVLDESVEVSVVKSDADGKLLAGAEFQATQIGLAEGSEPQTVTVTTNADGVATMSGLVAGTRYELSEVAAPDGYERTDETAVFAVNEDGTVVLENFMPRAYAMGSAPDTLTVTDTPLEVSLVKQAPNGAPLAGGEFTIRGAFPDGSTSKSFTSGEDGVVFDRLQLTGSAEGVSYTITETRAPEGYYLPDGSLELVVFDDGTVQVGGASSAAMSGNTSVSQDGGTAVVTVDNQPMPGTELPRTGDTLTALTTGLLGVVGLAAVVTCGVGVRAVRRKLARLQRAK